MIGAGQVAGKEIDEGIACLDGPRDSGRHNDGQKSGQTLFRPIGVAFEVEDTGALH